MVFQVEGAVTRAYNRWIEDLTSLPEYRAALQTEREKWEVLQEKRTGQQVGTVSVFEVKTDNAVKWLFFSDHVLFLIFNGPGFPGRGEVE